MVDKRILTKPEKEFVLAPNKVLETIAEFSVYQLRIYVTIIELLQDIVVKSFDDFQFVDRERLAEQTVLLTIPLKKISKPSEYRDVKKSLLLMSKVNCEITYYKNGEKLITSGSLFTVDMPEKANWKSTIGIRLHPEIARHMFTFQRNNLGKPMFYSKVNPSVVRKIKNKHAIRLYLFFCLWRHKEMVSISVENLYRILGIDTKYELFSNFKKHILVPSSSELAKHGDLWFDINAPGFLVKQGNRTTTLNFIIVSQAAITARETHKKGIEKALITHYRFNDRDFEQIQNVLDNLPINIIWNKINELHEKMTQKVKNPKPYIITSLNKEFQDYIQ